MEIGIFEGGGREWVEVTTHGSHGLGGVEQEVCCGETEGDDDLGIDDTDLFD